MRIQTLSYLTLALATTLGTTLLGAALPNAL